MRLLLLALVLVSAPLASAQPVTRNVIYGGPVLGANALGGRLGYEFRRVDDGDWSLPLSFEVTVVHVDNADNDFEGLLVGYSGGASLARRIGETNAHLQAGLQVSVGTEEVEGDRDFLLGTRVSLGVLRYPPDTGLVMGAGVYGVRVFGSEIYPDDLGVTLTIGRQF